MKKVDAIRAWKDPLYRASLSAEELAALPVHPAGALELDEDQLQQAAGALRTTFRTCTQYSLAGCCP